MPALAAALKIGINAAQLALDVNRILAIGYVSLIKERLRASAQPRSDIVISYRIQGLAPRN